MTNEPTPETDDFRPCHLTPSDWPAFARAMEIQRNAARAERDAAISLGRHAMFCVHHTDAERDALRADVARLRDVLQRIVTNGGSATNVMLFDALTTPAQ
jgi:hypothetical protein